MVPCHSTFFLPASWYCMDWYGLGPHSIHISAHWSWKTSVSPSHLGDANYLVEFVHLFTSQQKTYKLPKPPRNSPGIDDPSSAFKIKNRRFETRTAKGLPPAQSTAQVVPPTTGSVVPPELSPPALQMAETNSEFTVRRRCSYWRWPIFKGQHFNFRQGFCRHSLGSEKKYLSFTSNLRNI